MFGEGSFTPHAPSWRLRRRLRHLTRKANAWKASPFIADSTIHLPSIDDSGERSHIASWVHSLHPAIEARQWLAAEFMDKIVMQRLPVSVDEKVTVHLKRRLKSSESTFIQAVESAFNSLSKGKQPPLIIDSGASCCISPCREDFITYEDSKVRVKDLSGVNRVAGEGMVEWKVLDRFGREFVIQIKAYHMPKAVVRLLSPQCVFQAFRGSCGGQNHKQYVLRLSDGTVLEAPYGSENLPKLQLSSDGSPACLWTRCFAFQNVDQKLWARSVLDQNNLNLTAAQRELMRWHQRLSHAGLSTIHNLCRQKRTQKVDSETDLVSIRQSSCLPCTFNVPSSSCDGLLCAACEISKASRRSPAIRAPTKGPDKDMVLKENDVQPGDCFSCDHFMSPVKGRVVAASGHSSSSSGYECGTLYVDHSSGWIFVNNQKSTSAEETIRGKLLLEREAADVNVHVKKYHSDNGVFSSDAFRSHCELLDQKLSFSGVGAKFQNGVAERAIQTVSNMARANMLHATMRWPGRKFLDLWPLAIEYAVWIHNRLPPSGAGWSPEELWSRQKATQSHLPRAHVFGCPVYVLDAKLQDNKKIPKWDSRARQGIFVGFSKHHSSTVPLILNPRTQHISPQFHVIFDDDFSTVPAVSTEISRNQEFERLFELSRERFIDPFDAGADPQLPEDAVEPPSPYLDDEWLSDRDLNARNKSRATDTEIAVGETPNGDSEGASDSAQEQEGASVPPDLWPSENITSEGADAPITPSPPPSLHRQEQRPTYETPPSSPVRPTRKKSLSWKDGPVRLRQKSSGKIVQRGFTHFGLTNVLALSAAWNWGQPPPAVSNIGKGASLRFGQSRIRHVTLAESYLLQSDWTQLGKSACDGQHSLFSAYFDPDLSDEVGSYTITDVQPHLLKASTSSNAADNPSFQQAINSPFAEKWWEAMNIEMNTLEVDIDAWELVRRESWMNVLPSTWAFKIKRFPDGLVKKFKARFCVRGDKQLEGVDYFETWSPVVQWTTVRSMLILAARQKLVTAQADITAAFVHANLAEGEHIYVHQPAGFKRGENMVLKLKRSVYGLKQAPRYFFKYLSDHLQKQGLTQSKRDPCLFFGKNIIAVVYVDDILFFAKEDEHISILIERLKQSGIAIRREGSAEGFLGVDIERSSTDLGQQQLIFRQTGLTKRIVSALGLDGSTTKCNTPAETSPLPKDSDGDPASGSFNYAAVVGMLLYLSGHSRPDIAFAVSQVARYTFKPTRRHELALYRPYREISQRHSESRHEYDDHSGASCGLLSRCRLCWFIWARKFTGPSLCQKPYWLRYLGFRLSSGLALEPADIHRSFDYGS